MKQTNRLDQAKNFLTNTIGRISENPTPEVDQATNLALQTAVNVAPKVLPSQPLIQGGGEQISQQSQAPSTNINPAQLATDTANIINNQPPRQKIVGQDTIGSLYDDIKLNGLSEGELQKLYPEITPEVLGSIYDDITYNDISESDIPKYYPELTLGSQDQSQAPTLQGGFKGGLGKQGGDIRMVIPSWQEIATNPFGAITETIDNLIQQIPNFDFSGAKEGYTNRLNSVSQEEINKYREKFASSKAIQTLYGSEESYIKEQQKSFIDKALGIGEGGPNVALMAANTAPSLVKFISGVARATTNPYDALKGLGSAIIQLSQGTGPLADRYGSIDKFINTMEQDPVGVASDVMTVTDPFLRVSGGGMSKLGFTEQGAKVSQFGKTMGSASDLGIGMQIGKGLDNMSAWGATKGPMVQGLLDSTISMTRPLTSLTTAGAKQLARAKEVVQGQLLPESIIDKQELVNNPYTKATFDDFQQRLSSEPDITTKDFTNSTLSDYLNSWKQKREAEMQTKMEAYPGYDMMKKYGIAHDITPMQDTVLALADQHNIGVTFDEGKPILDFKDSDITSKSERTNIQEVTDTLFSSKEKKTDALMNNRNLISDRIDYDTGDPYKRGQSLFMRELRDNVDKYAKNAIPYFSEMTTAYGNQLKKLEEGKGVLFNNDGTIKASVYGKLLNIDSPANIEFKKQIESIDPSLPAKARALKLLQNIEAIKTSDKGLGVVAKIFEVVGGSLGYSIFGNFFGGALGYGIARTLEGIPLDALKKLRYDEILKLINTVTDEQTNFVKDIQAKIDEGQKVTNIDKERIRLLVENISAKAKVLIELREEQ